MLHRFLLSLILLALALPASAGPWLREKGSSFVASSVAINRQLDSATQTYLEYGLSEKTTLVADVGMARLQTILTGGSVTLSLRRAIGPPDRASKLAYELGGGVEWTGTQTLPHLRTALSWGRGMTWGKKSGWMTVEGSVLWDLTNALHVRKLDTTLGINLTDATSAMLQLYTAHSAGEGLVTLAPSVVFTPFKGKFRLQIGSETEIRSPENSALKIGLWREF